ncbi:MAG: hypothetical protein ACP5NF_06100 [Thermoanaerobaculum sp.]
MRAAVAYLVVFAGVFGAWAQEEPSYRSGENPFQDEYQLKLGEPVKLYVDIEGTRFAELTIVPRGNVEPGKNVKCQVLMTGARVGSGKVEVLPVFLLEDGSGKSLERVTPPPFKVRGKRPFEYKETVTVGGDSLAAAAKVWVFLEIR